MGTKQICSACKQPLAPNAPQGLCPQCLIQAGLPTGMDIGPDTESDLPAVPFVPPTPEELASFFPQLEILALIGQGGMGAVYKARQKQLDRIVALKILPPGIGEEAAFAERFTREAKALAKLNHPGIVTLYEFGQVAQASTGPAQQLYYFLMEFVDGMNLRQLLARGRVSAREALAIVPEICDALQFAHDQGIVHRDIKPENILLDRRGRVKVADFGLAKIMAGASDRGDLGAEAGRGAPSAAPDTLTDGSKVMGTPQYMAPEQISAPGEVDHRADIYALGVVLYQMLTGELPGKQLEPPSRKVHIDVRLDKVVLRALNKDPERRYQQVSVLKTQVETLAATVPVSETAGVARAATLSWRDHWLWNHRNWIIWCLAVLVLLALPLLSFWISNSGGRGTPWGLTPKHPARTMSERRTDQKRDSSVMFGSEIQVILTEFNDRQGREGLDLDTFKVFPQPRDMDGGSEDELLQWSSETGIDLMVDHGPKGRWGLITTTAAELKLSLVGDETWEGIGKKELLRALALRATGLQSLEGGARKLYPLPENSSLPLTFAFQTSRGAMGLLRVAGFTENPGGVTIRCKLAQAADVTHAEPVAGFTRVSLDKQLSSSSPPMARPVPVIVEGEGWRAFRVGATRAELIKELGQPDSDSDNRWLKWKQKHFVHCLMDDTRGAFELRFDEGFPGITTSGIRIGSTLKEALEAYGKPSSQLDNGTAKKLIWSAKGILIWFSDDKATQIVVFRKG